MVPGLIDVKLYFQFCRPQCVTDLNFYPIGKKITHHEQSFQKKSIERIHLQKLLFFLITNVIHICSWLFRKDLKERENKKPTPQR